MKQLTALLLVLTAACSSAPKEREMTEEQKLDLYVTTATYLYEDGSYVRAQDQAVKALEIEPRNRPMRRMVGWVRIHMGKPGDLAIAEQFFRELMAEGDDDPTTAIGLASVLERLGLAYDKRSQEIAQGQEADSSQEGRAREFASKARDRWAEALRLFEGTLVEGEGSSQAINGLQRVHALLGNYEESLAWAQRLLERSEQELNAWRRILQDAELTEREEKLMRTNEGDSLSLQRDTHLLIATLLHRLSRAEEAIAHLDSVLDLGLEAPQVYSLRAQLRHASGDYGGAISDLDRFLSLSDQPFEHPDVQRAFDLRSACEAHL